MAQQINKYVTKSEKKMSTILDELDIIKNIENMYESNSAFGVLKDFERVLDELDLYVYRNWADGELAEGPVIDRHWITVKLFWPENKMPDPMGGKRLLDYDCKVGYVKGSMLKPRKIMTPDDIRPGTKKGKMDRHPIWIVELRMPKKLVADMFGAELEDLDVQDEMEDMGAPQPDAMEDQVAPAGEVDAT